MDIKITELEILSNPNNQTLGELVRQKYWNQTKTSEKIIYDECTICGRKSPYTIDTHVDLREGYIKGAGQGCFLGDNCEK
jgi:hypothetical protein